MFRPKRLEALEILYKDSLLLAINKPAGLPVHKGAGRKMVTLEDYLDYLRFGLPLRPELAHRLDKDTTGCLLLGRNKVALKRLSELFQKQQISKSYVALVHGKMEQPSGEINLNIAKKSKDKKSWWGKIDPNGQDAVTIYEVLASTSDASLVKLTPLTGRTHQLRIHLQALGHPIMGDAIYGLKGDKKNLCLHCYSMEVPLYAKREKIVVRAILPELFELSLLGYGLNFSG